MASDMDGEEEEDSAHCAAELMTNRPFPTVEEPETPLPPLLFGGYVREIFPMGNTSTWLQPPKRAADQETRG